jgi:mono/diheme cytochrome c family protein
MKPIFKPVLATIAVLAILGILTGLTVIYSGIFNVGATVSDARLLRWVLITTREASEIHQARSIRAPALGGADSGFRIYRDVCVKCHAAPGRTVPVIARGLNPPALDLRQEASEMSPAQLFWVTKNGIRFTGMPAWTATLTDAQIWDTVAFMKRLPQLKPDDYDALERRFPAAPQSQDTVATPMSAQATPGR